MPTEMDLKLQTRRVIRLLAGRRRQYKVAKYDSMRKLERNRVLYEYYLSHPELSVREVGKAFNITGQRVCKIIQAEKKKATAAETVA